MLRGKHCFFAKKLEFPEISPDDVTVGPGGSIQSMYYSLRVFAYKQICERSGYMATPAAATCIIHACALVL